MNDHTILEAMRAVIGDQAALTKPFELILRPDEHRVSLLDVGGSTRLVAPDLLTAQSVQHLLDKDPLFWDHAIDSAERVAAAAGWRHHVAEVLGPARLLTTDVAPVVLGDVSVLTRGESSLQELIARASPHEVDESGVREFVTWYGSFDGDLLVGVAGWEQWPGSVAKIGLLVDEETRGKGHGTAVGAMATAAALADELLPLWRARSDNGPSLRVAERLGYVGVGHQLSVVLAPR